jgi:two-component sensor histidine kinase
MLRPQAALFIALAVHELSTNAAKYGALSVPGGRVAVLGSSQATCLRDWRSIGGKKVDQGSTDLGPPGLARNLSSAVSVSNCRAKQS